MYPLVTASADGIPSAIPPALTLMNAQYTKWIINIVAYK